MVENARFRAVSVEVAHECVRHADIVTASPALIGGVHAHVGNEEIQQAVAIVVEEHSAGRVPTVPDAGCSSDVAKLPRAQVLEELIPVAYRGHEEIRISIVVDVGERARHRDRIRHHESRLVGDVHEPSAAGVLPQLVGAELGGEVEIGEAIAIHVSGTHSGSVVVVDQLVILPRVVYDTVYEADTAGLPPISETEVVRDGRMRG